MNRQNDGDVSCVCGCAPPQPTGLGTKRPLPRNQDCHRVARWHSQLELDPLQTGDKKALDHQELLHIHSLGPTPRPVSV